MLMLLLSFFGVLNPTYGSIEYHLDNQLNNHISQTEHDIDKLAAHSLSFSKEMETLIEDYLARNDITFNNLANNIEALTTLQTESYQTVYTNIRVAPCSGAFYMLNTTVNTSTETPHHNGIYIKYTNIYSENNVNTNVALFRGASRVARENNINLFSTWQNEMKTSVFDDVSIFSEKSYILSSVTKIPDTWERARYIYSPIYAKDGSVIGICGFEISDLYMQLAHSATDTESNQVVCALLDKTNKGYIGQFISNRSGYMPPSCETITTKKHGAFYEYKCGNNEYIGKEREIEIDTNKLTIAIMFPKKQYESIVCNGWIKNIAIFSIISIIGFSVCLWLSKKYIDPIRKGITQLKTKNSDFTPSGIAEIDDLFVFLAEQDRKNEATISQMESQNTHFQNILAQISAENSEAKLEIARLAYSRKKEVDPDNYDNFLTGVKTLTQTERTVFEYYLDGKKVKEIVELMGIKESTVRFHNRNIYSKLGVNSLKQMLLYASIMKSDENTQNNN